MSASADWRGDGPDEGTGDRLQKVLARAGFGSRRVCDDMIAAGRVEVNGEVAQLGRRVDPEVDHIRVDGVDVSIRPGLVYYLLNKPAGMVSTASDPEGRPTVISAVPSEPRVHSVGRLDAATEGLLVLTNDGDLTFRLTHPRYGVEKEYLAELATRPRPAALRALREGVELEDGMTAPARVSQVGDVGLRIVIHEGRNRQVRRMCDAVGHPVVRLARIRIGPLADRRLSPGEWRSLTADEIRALEEAAARLAPPGATRAERRAGERRAAERGKANPDGR
ncbi:MAG: rRNA pseudouridine synthase [Acidimicrobiaceae bacterium]|nr:rRNA pseudouridine synthase [Acidimicrobiaceae bacterium]